MLGYGLVNSAVHEICLSQIITSFLSRSSIFLANYYFSTYLKLDANILSEEEKDNIINLFLEEEKYIEIQKNKKSPSVDFNEEEITYKYLLSANVVANKDYNFDLKTTEEILKDGKTSLKNIFLNIFKKFISDFIENIGGATKIPALEEPTSSTQDFLLNLIKYSTFIFANNSVARWNGSIDYIEKKAIASKQPPKQPSAEEIITQVLLFFGESEEEVINPLKDIAVKLQEGGYFKTFYCPPVNSKYNVGEKVISNIEYNEPPSDNNFYNYFTSGGKFFNYGKSKDKKIDPIIFAEFYYTVKPEKINEFFQKSFTGPGLYEQIFEGETQLGTKKEYLFKDFQYCFHSVPYFEGDNNTTVNQKNFLYLRQLGYFSDYSKGGKNSSQYSDKTTQYVVPDGTTVHTLSTKEIFKYYKFSFTELKNIAKALKDNKKKFEDYFDLNFRINLNLNADLDSTDNDSEKILDNHHIYELFNIPYKNLKDGDTQLSTYPIFFRNSLFNQPILSGHDDVQNIIHDKFEIFEFDLKIKNNEVLYKALPMLYSYLLRSPINIPLGNKPENNTLFKMLFGKEGIVFTVDEYNVKNPIYDKFKINYFENIVDFKIDSKNESIYFSSVDDAKDALYLIKNKFYKQILNKLYEIYNSSDTNNIKRILDSYNFDSIKNDIQNQLSSVKKPEYIISYENDIKNIYKFYEEIKITEQDIYSILLTRETALNILNGQIKVLENG